LRLGEVCSAMLSDVARKPVGPLLVALAATVATLSTLGPGTSGPGVTCDELYHVDAGKRLVTALRHQGLAFFHPDHIEQNFPWTPGRPTRGWCPPVQAPLGHWILGWTHHLFDPQPDDPAVVSIAAARFAPGLAFGLLVLLVGFWTTRVEGHLAGTVAAAAVVLVPRVFGHAHLAALDMLTTLFFVAAVWAVAQAARGGPWWHFALAGMVWGLAMLVRLHGVLLLPVVIIWLMWRFRWKGWLPTVTWGAAGMATLFAGWPWLWLAPISHLRQFLASGAGRQAIHVFYAGRVWADRDVPWHYPAVMFVVALPLGLFLLGLLGIWARRRKWNAEPHLLLVGGTWLFVLAVFSWPGVPVYDGVRLFLMVFPLWAIWVGVGVSWLVEHPALPWLSRRLRLLGLALVLAFQATGLAIYHPCQLSHYSLLVGGLAGAARLGFEVSYWGDAVREPLLAQAAARSAGRPILLAPHLAPWQAAAVSVSSEALAEHETWLLGWEPQHPERAATCRLAVIYDRRADLDVVHGALRQGRVVAKYTKQGVWLAKLIELPQPLGNPDSPCLAPSARTPSGEKGN
jgi:4-amino-4-deoxy-L-arabinose transferase-like glycosyltransferase